MQLWAFSGSSCFRAVCELLTWLPRDTLCAVTCPSLMFLIAAFEKKKQAHAQEKKFCFHSEQWKKNTNPETWVSRSHLKNENKRENKRENKANLGATDPTPT